MRDTLSIECLIQALDSYAKASREEDEARERYDGYSWGYHGSSYINDKERAAEQVKKQLDEYINSRIKAVSNL